MIDSGDFDFLFSDHFLARVNTLRMSEAKWYTKSNSTLTMMFGINTIVATLAAVTTFATMDRLGMTLPSSQVAFLMVSVWNVGKGANIFFVYVQKIISSLK